jgi:hypothetical protein
MELNSKTSMEVWKAKRVMPYGGGFDEFFGKKLPAEGFIIEETESLYRIVTQAKGDSEGNTVVPSIPLPLHGGVAHGKSSQGW